MEFITIALFGALLTTTAALIPASLAMNRNQPLLALIITLAGAGLGLASPFISPSLSPLIAIAGAVVITLGLYFVLPKTESAKVEPRIRLSFPDILALLAGGLMLFSFFFIPWYIRFPVDLDAVPQSLMARLYGGSIRQLDLTYVLESRFALDDFRPLMIIFLVATFGAFATTIGGIFSTKIRPHVAKWTLTLAGVGFLYYLLYAINSNFFLPVIKTADAGFWMGFFGVILLAFQAILPRPAVIVQKELVVRKQMEVVDDQGVITLQTEGVTKSISNLGRAMRRLRRDRLTLIAMGILGFLLVITFVSPWINEYVLGKNPVTTNGVARLTPPGGCFDTRGNVECFVLGSDQIGRDYLARILEGGRISLLIAFASAMLTATVGSILGMAAGYFGGVFDDFMNWIITTLNSLPQLYLLIAISAILKPDPTSLVIVFVVTGWTGSMRLIRGQTIATRGLDYVMAARALGASPWRIMREHIFPNMISLLSVTLALGIGGVILAEAALSFLNLGISAATPTWGNMLSKVGENLQGFFRDAPHLVITPGLLITITVLCLFVMGDGIRDAFDPTIN
nr:ABC transporter permease [Anaerolineae bacterium]